MADYELTYKDEGFGSPINCIKITEEQYYACLNYIDNKDINNIGRTNYEIICYKRKFGEPIKVKYLTKELFNDILKFLEGFKKTSNKKYEYNIFYDKLDNCITAVLKTNDRNKLPEKIHLYRKTCPLKFDLLCEKFFGKNIEHAKLVKISQELYEKLKELFPYINSYSSKYIIDEISKIYRRMENKNYYLTYSKDKDIFRIFDKKPREYLGMFGDTSYQGKSLFDIQKGNNSYNDLCIKYGSRTSYIKIISEEEYNKILKIFNNNTNINNVKTNISRIKENAMTNKNTNDKKTMMSSMTSKFTSQFIPAEENDVKLSMDGNLVVKQGDEYVGIIGDKNELKSYPEEMCFDVPVYSINKSSKDIKVGDIIKRKNTYYKVTSIRESGSFSLLGYNGNYTSSKEIKDAVLNQSFERVLINYFSQEENNFGFNPMMFLMLKDSNFDTETLMMMSMMNQNGNTGLNFGNLFGNTNGFNPMMLMLMKDKGNSLIKDLVTMTMMSNMFNTQNSPKQVNS